MIRAGRSGVHHLGKQEASRWRRPRRGSPSFPAAKVRPGSAHRRRPPAPSARARGRDRVATGGGRWRRRARASAASRRAPLGRARLQAQREQVPRPSCDARTSGWSSSAAVRRTRMGPSPSPLLRSRSGLFSWWNSQNTRSCSGGGMPGPVSQTRMRTPPRVPAADQHAAAPGMRDGVADEIARDALSSTGSDHHRLAGPDPQRQAFAPPAARYWPATCSAAD